MQGYMLGEFEYLILAATVRLGDNAYGAAIVAVTWPIHIGSLKF